MTADIQTPTEVFDEARAAAHAIVDERYDRRVGNAPKSAPTPTAAFDPADHTVSEVLDYVEANPEQADTVLAAEKAGKNRSTIVDVLEGG